MFLLRSSILLAWSSTLSLAIPTSQSTANGGVSPPNTVTPTLAQPNADNGARRVKYGEQGDGAPSLISPWGGVALAGTGLVSSWLTARVLRQGHQHETAQLRLDKAQLRQELKEMKAEADRRVRSKEMSTVQRSCYGQKVCVENTQVDLVSTRSLHMRTDAHTHAQQLDFYELFLGVTLNEDDKKRMWEECLRRNQIPLEPEWAWESAKPTLLEARHRARKRRTRPEGDHNPFTLEQVGKAAQPLMTDLGRNLKQVPGAIARHAPAMLRSTAARAPAAMRAMALS